MQKESNIENNYNMVMTMANVVSTLTVIVLRGNDESIKPQCRELIVSLRASVDRGLDFLSFCEHSDSPSN